MRSRAQIKSHPLHPILIPFPIAFLSGAFAADLGAWFTGSELATLFGGYLGIAGVATGLVAAIPGFIDYLYTVPPRSSGRRRATRHMVVNVGAVAAFAVVALMRGGPAAAIGPGLLLVEATGLALLVAGGWMGGTLVYRNQIGVDHRYAGAGRWNEARAESRDEGTLVARIDELEVDQMKLVHLDGQRVVVARTEEGFVAFDDRCTHRGGSLAGGTMICGTVQCPWHGSQFDVGSGEVRAGPAESGITVHRVEVRDGEVWLHT